MTTPAAVPLIRTFLDDDNLRTLGLGLGRIERLRKRNERLSFYYDGKARVQQIGVAVSSEFDMIKTVIGWPGTAVDVKAERSNIDQILVPGSPALTEQLQAAWTDNDMEAESGMASANSRIHGISFVVVGKHEGRTVILPTSATKMTCEYDRAGRRITSAVSSSPSRRFGDPTMASIYNPGETITVERRGPRWLIVDRQTNNSGIVPVERLVNRPRLDEDAMWGRSDITPAVISATDNATRTVLSMEVAREIFSMPLRYALDADPESFENEDGSAKRAFDLFWGGFIALYRGEIEDENGEMVPGPEPKLQQLQGQSPSGLVEMMKMNSQLIAAETGIPPSNLGFVTENPPSGDGMRMYENRLVLNARAFNRLQGGSFARVGRLALIADGVDPASIPPVKVVWDDPATFTPTAATDAVAKQIEAGVLPAVSDVALERLGYDRATVMRIKADRKTSQHVDLVNNLALVAGNVRKADPAVAAAAATRV